MKDVACMCLGCLHDQLLEVIVSPIGLNLDPLDVACLCVEQCAINKDDRLGTSPKHSLIESIEALDCWLELAEHGRFEFDPVFLHGPHVLNLVGKRYL